MVPTRTVLEMALYIYMYMYMYMYIHGMYTRNVESVRYDVLKLEALALRAFGSPSDYESARRKVTDHEALLDAARESRRNNRSSS